MISELIIRVGSIVDPVAGSIEPATVYVADGKIARIEKGDKPKLQSQDSIDVTGCLICPGLIDMHVHLREPGREDEETIESGAHGAVAGGFTAVLCMPNTEPALDCVQAIEFVMERAQAALSRVYPCGAATIGRKGEALTEMIEMAEYGARVFSDDGSGIQNNDLMRRALEYAKVCKVPIISHCEYDDLVAGGVMNEGLVSTVLGMRGIPSVAEELMVARDMMLADYTKSRVHIAHVSTAGSVELIRVAKKAHIQVTAEATPHHFTLTDECVRTFDTNYKVNPPLRTHKDVEAIKEGLKDDTIDCIVSDHAPHAIEEKELEFDYAPCGMIGLETTLGLVSTELVEKGVLSWPQAIAKMTVNPARILNLPGPYGLNAGGVLAVGSLADLTIIDPNLNWVAKKEDFKSLSHNTPFVGREVKGRAVMTVVGGRVVHSLL